MDSIKSDEVSFKLINATIFPCMSQINCTSTIESQYVRGSITVKDGIITAIEPCDSTFSANSKTIDLKQKLVLPTFIDLHTHIDKSHTIIRSPNPPGTYSDALLVAYHDQTNFKAEELKIRTEFSLRTAYYYGSQSFSTSCLSFNIIFTTISSFNSLSTHINTIWLYLKKFY